MPAATAAVRGSMGARCPQFASKDTALRAPARIDCGLRMSARLDGGTLSSRCPRFVEQMRCALRVSAVLGAACECLRRPLPVRLNGVTLSSRCPQFAGQMRCALRTLVAQGTACEYLRLANACVDRCLCGSMGARSRHAVRDLPSKCAVHCACLPCWVRLVNACVDRCLRGSMGTRCPQFASKDTALRAPARIDCGLRLSAATAAVRLDGGMLSLRCPQFARQVRCVLRTSAVLSAACECLRRPLPARLSARHAPARVTPDSAPSFRASPRCAADRRSTGSV